MTERWHTVKTERRGKKDGEKNRYRSLGLHHSNTPFSQWNALEWSHERSKTGSLKLDDNKLAEGKEGRESIRHRSRGKRQKKMKLQFDEVVVELDATYLVKYIENLKNENSESPLVWLKQVTDYLQMQFKDIQPETDYTFSKRDPVYPASVLNASLRGKLVSYLCDCPSLTLEGLFRHCLTCMLGEVRRGVSSHGTRLVIQLIREAKPEVSTAVSETIHLLIQSCGPKVAEILSLLWAGLPHPLSNSHISLVAWQQLVLPFLHKVSSCPNQVLSHCLNYTALLLRCLNVDERIGLSQCVPPTTLSAVLSFPAVMSHRVHGSVKEICRLFQEHLLSSDNIVEYFSTIFLELGRTDHNELLMDFAVTCICRSTLCLSSWICLAPRNTSSSKLLLTHLANHWATVRTQLQIALLKETLTCLTLSINLIEHRQLCQEILENIANLHMNEAMSGSRKANCGSNLCTILVWIAAALYLLILSVFFIYVATHGPELEIMMLTKVLSPAEWHSLLHHATHMMWECHVLALNVLKWLFQT